MPVSSKFKTFHIESRELSRVQTGRFLLALSCVFYVLRISENCLFLLDIPANPEIYATNSDHAKQAEYAVLTLLFLAIKHDLDNQKLRALLEKHAVSNVVAEELIGVYDRHKSQLRIKNITTGLNVAHITNVEWKLTCDVKSSHVDGDAGGLLFRVNLGRFKEMSGEREAITEFMCNVEELQFLINRLKDIERHCEKIVNGK